MKKLSISIFKYKKRNLSVIQSTELLQRLYQLLNHGFTLFESFRFLNHHFDYKDKTLSHSIIHSIQTGSTCYDILKLIGYPDIILIQIKFAKNYGSLEKALIDSIHYMERNIKAKKQLIKTLQYSIVLISIFMIILIVLNMTVIPQFQQLYSTMNVELSIFQNILTTLITQLPKTLGIISLILIIGIFILLRYFRKLSIKKQIYYILKVPILQSYDKILRTYQFSNELSRFYKNSISLQQIVNIYKSEQNNAFFKFLGNYLHDETNKGIPLPIILKQLQCFQYDMVKFMQQGEKSGKLDIELKLYSQMLLQQFEDKVIKHTKFIQPIIFFILGLFIVSLYLVIMLPMFELMQTIK